MFENSGQKVELIVCEEKQSICILIRSIGDVNDFKMFPLNNVELVELRNLLTSFVDSRKRFAQQSDIQEAELVE